MSAVTVRVGRGADDVDIDREVFALLFGNSVVCDYADCTKALSNGAIDLDDLKRLARQAQIPYSLFFAPVETVRHQVEAKTTKLLEGTSKTAFSVNARGTVELRQVELIVKDLMRKQMLLKDIDTTLATNRIVGMLSRTSASVEADADALRTAIGIDLPALRSRGKTAALDLLIARLEANQIFVSRSARGYMPQTSIPRFSGITIRDKEVPYIFLPRESDKEEPAGRQIFTLTLLTVLVARRIFAPVTYDARISGPGPGREYSLAEEVLMPAKEVRPLLLNSADDVSAAANDFKVTPSALAVRAWHVKAIDAPTANAFLDEFAKRFANTKKQSGAGEFLPVNGVLRYTGVEYASRMLGALDKGALSTGQFLRAVCLNRIGPSQLGELRAALR